MGAVRMLTSSDLRRRWGSALLLTVLVGLVGAVVLASVAGARRTASSLQRFEQESAAADLEINAGFTTREQLRAFERTPSVRVVGVLRQLSLFLEKGTFLPTAGPVNDAFGTTIDRPRLIDGRLARAVDEVNIGEQLADRLGVRVGDTMRFRSFTPEQTASPDEETFEAPQGPIVTLRIVGIVRRPLDLGGRGAAGGVLVPTRAFTDAYRDRVGSFGGNVLRVRTAHGAADVPQVAAAARRIFGDFAEFGVLNLAIEGDGIQSAIDVTAVGLWVLAAVAAGAGLIAFALTLARYMAHRYEDDEVLRAMGLRWWQRWAATLASALPVAIGGAVLSMVVAFFASPIFPLGVASDAETHPGLDVDVAALALGGFGVLVVVLAVAGITAAIVISRVAHDATRPALPTAAAARAGLPTSMSTGVGFALERQVRGRRGVPVWSSLVGASFGVLGVVAALLLGSSLDRLVTNPAMYGWTWDYVAVDSRATGEDVCGSRGAFADDATVGSVTLLCLGIAEVDGRPTSAYALDRVRGDIEPTVVSGRAPRTAREVALGRATLEAAGKGVGDIVTVRGPDGARRFRVVGTTVFPTIPEADPQPLADGVTLTKAGIDSIGAADNGYALVSLAHGIDDARARAHLDRVGQGFTARSAVVPSEIDRLHQIDRLPMVLAAFIAAVALVAVGYALVTGVRRRRHDLAILKTLGYRRQQVRATVAWHATTVALVGLVIGVPVGVVVGKLIWGLIADDLGVSPSAAVPVLALSAVVVGVLLVANLVAAVPARAAARIRPAVVLRSE